MEEFTVPSFVMLRSSDPAALRLLDEKVHELGLALKDDVALKVLIHGRIFRGINACRMDL